MKKLSFICLCIALILTLVSCREAQGSPLGGEDADSIPVKSESRERPSSSSSDIDLTPMTALETVSNTSSSMRRMDTLRGFTIDFSKSYEVSENDEFLRIYPKTTKDGKEGLFIHLVTSPLTEADFVEPVLKATLDSKGVASKYGKYETSTLKSGIKIFSHEALVDTSTGKYAMKCAYFNLGGKTQIIEACLSADSLSKLDTIDTMIKSIIEVKSDESSN